jgi:hypothetical protein
MELLSFYKQFYDKVTCSRAIEQVFKGWKGWAVKQRRKHVQQQGVKVRGLVRVLAFSH